MQKRLNLYRRALYSLFVVRHVGTAKLDSLDKVERVESCRVKTSQVEFGPKAISAFAKNDDSGAERSLQNVLTCDHRAMTTMKPSALEAINYLVF